MVMMGHYLGRVAFTILFCIHYMQKNGTILVKEPDCVIALSSQTNCGLAGDAPLPSTSYLME